MDRRLIQPMGPLPLYRPRPRTNPKRAGNNSTCADRIARLVWALANGQVLTTEYIRRKFGVSESIAKRDLRIIELVINPAAPKRRIGFNRPTELRIGSAL